MPYRAMCSSCGHTHDADTINDAVLDISHERDCLCFMGVGIKHLCIDLSKAEGKEGHPKYFKSYNDGIGFKSNTRPS